MVIGIICVSDWEVLVGGVGSTNLNPKFDRNLRRGVPTTTHPLSPVVPRTTTSLSISEYHILYNQMTSTSTTYKAIRTTLVSYASLLSPILQTSQDSVKMYLYLYLYQEYLSLRLYPSGVFSWWLASFCLSSTAYLFFLLSTILVLSYKSYRYIDISFPIHWDKTYSVLIEYL